MRPLTTAGLWASSYLVEFRGLTRDGGRLVNCFRYYRSRFLSGFIADKLGDRALIRYGLIVIFMGIILIGLPISGSIIAPMGLVITGLGCEPIYQTVIHATPANFGEDKSQAVIGVQMASAYVGTTLMPPVFGFIADKINIGLYPLYLLLFAIIMIIMSERLNATV